MKYSFVFVFAIISLTAIAQRDKSKILANTHVTFLHQYADALSKDYHTRHKEALRLAKVHGWDTKNLLSIDAKGQPVYGGDFNNIALNTTKTVELHSGGSLNLNLTGDGFIIGMWEGKIPRPTHFNLGMGTISSSRINDMDGTPFGDHATHVGGTLVGDGSHDSDAKGMAPEAEINAYDNNNELSEMATAASNGLLVSNHSWGFFAGWKVEGSEYHWYGGASTYNSSGEDPDFGLYDQRSQTTDEVAFNAPYYLKVRSSGNNNNDNPPIGATVRLLGSSTTATYDPAIHPAGDATGGDNITFASIPKNILTVGAIDGNNANIITSFSSRGPVDDGRIKPDIVGHGQSVYSSSDSSDTFYKIKSGTSMSCPNVAGSALLLQEYYEDLHGSGQFMRSATLKAVILHTAEDLGNPGPDYTYGWGLLNAQAAALLLKADDEHDGVKIMENTHDGSTAEFGLLSSCAEDVSIMMVYTDRAGAIQTTLDDPTPHLVNDLDLRLYDPQNIIYPWKLNPNSPNSNATTGDNNVDNVEQIISPPNQNVQLAYVLDDGSLVGGQQDYSIIFENVEEFCSVIALIQGPITLTADESFCSTISFTTEANIPSGRTIKYTNPNKISLIPGFKAAAGSDVRVYITPPCD